MDVVAWVSVFSVFIALVALVLSQLPPLKYLLRKRQIIITTPDFFKLNHAWGNATIWMFLAIHNRGGRDVTIARIHCLMTNSDEFHLDLPSQTYMAGGTQELQLGWISLKPEEHWSETVGFWKVWSEAEERKANQILSKIRTNMRSQQPSPTVEAEALAEARSVFENKFKLDEGSYQLFISALSESGEVITVRGFDFTLFESDIQNLRALIDHYKTGTVDNPEDTPEVWPRLRPMADGPALEAYKRIAPPRGISKVSGVCL